MYEAPTTPIIIMIIIVVVVIKLSTENHTKNSQFNVCIFIGTDCMVAVMDGIIYRWTELELDGVLVRLGLESRRREGGREG